MCLTLPAQVLEVASDGATAVVTANGSTRVVSLVVLAGDAVVVPGDWVLLGAGLAVARIEAGEAIELLGLLDEARKSTP